MIKFRKVGEFYTEESGSSQEEIKRAIEDAGYSICWLRLDEYGSGNHYVIMKEFEDDTNR